MFNLSMAILLLTGIFPLSFAIKSYLKSRDSKMLVLFLWFAVRIFEAMICFILVKIDQMNLFAYRYFSIVLETILIIGLAQVSLNSKSKIWFLLYLVPIQVLFYQGIVGITPLVEVSRFEINMYYYAISCILMLVLIFGNNTEPHFLRLFQLLFVYHMVVFFYVANLDFILPHKDLMGQTYPFFLAITAIFNLGFAYLIQKNRVAFASVKSSK